MTKKEPSTDAEVSEQAEAAIEVSALKELATLLLTNMDVIEYCQDRPADYLLPCSGLLEAISKLVAAVLRQVNELTREFSAQFDPDGAA